MMTIFVASRPIHGLGGISDAGRLVVRFIDGGPQWCDWATFDPCAHYRFDDESALLAGIQAGLHGSPFLLLAKTALVVSPVKLMTFNVADLRTMAQSEAGDESAPVRTRVAEILAAEGLVTQSDLARGTAFLEEKGVADAPVFQCLQFDDRLAMLDLANEPAAGGSAAPELQREAAAFAIGQSRTPQEFTDYYRAYLQNLAATGPPPAKPEARMALVEAAVDTLLPLLFGALDCPRVDGPAAPSEVGAAIDEWLMMGRRLGFARLSLGVQQVIANAGFEQQTGDDARRIVDAYLGAAQALLRSATLEKGRLGQDGTSLTCRVEGEGEEAIVRLGADGAIALAGYRRLNAP